MWRRMFGGSGRVDLAQALRAIEAEARWEALDLVARRGREAACDLLRGHAAELACSTAGRDQLLSLALDQAADALETGETSPQPDLSAFRQVRSVDASVQRRIRRRAAAGAIPPDPLDDAARTLHERLWADPRIPADDACRAGMLAGLASSSRKDGRAERSRPSA
jgi:hypothetical protein